MLVRLLPEQIGNNWHLISDGIVGGLQPLGFIDEHTLNRLLEAALADELQVWLVIDTVEGRQKIKGILTTCIINEAILDNKNLLIYSLYGFEVLHAKLWVSGLETLKKFAEGNNCKKIVAYSNVADIIKIMEILNADISWRLISVEV